jgi:hypothetical protein
MKETDHISVLLAKEETDHISVFENVRRHHNSSSQAHP